MDITESKGKSNKNPVVNNTELHTFLLSNRVNSVSKSVWHKRLGHPSTKVLESIVKICNLPVKVNEKLLFCDASQYGKAHALPFPDSMSRASHRFELIHTDLWGPAPIQSVQGFRYYALFLDDFSRYVWLYPLKHKSDTLAAFNHSVAMVKTQFTSCIKSLQSDNGGEYTPVHRRQCETLGIKIRLTCPHTSQKNGKAKRKHRHLVETGLTLLTQASMPLKY